ncbi:MAG: enoyl-CoA hydratase-related protein [Vicinamibacterales bacterium]
MSSFVRTTRAGSVATVVLDRPDKLNAMNLAMWRDLGAAVHALSTDDALRCVVIRGAGDKAFAAGADIAAFADERANEEQARDYGREMIETMQAIDDCRHPTVALIHGVCVGGGLELAAMCDLRICGASARFGIPIKRLGLVMAYGELRGLVNLVGPAVSLEILLEGRVFGAEEALQKGLVTRVVPDESLDREVAAAARRIAEGAPLVARWHKRFVRRLADPTPLTAEERDEGYACFATEDYRIGYRAFLEKTEPSFKGR